MRGRIFIVLSCYLTAFILVIIIIIFIAPVREQVPGYGGGDARLTRVLATSATRGRPDCALQKEKATVTNKRE